MASSDAEPPCPKCGNDSNSILTGIVHWAYGPDGAPIFRCMSCKTDFTNNNHDKEN